MRIRVSIKGPLIKYVSNNENVHILKMKEGSTISSLLDKLDLPRSVVGFVTVNGSIITMDYVLASDDEVLIFPHVSGG